MAAITFITSNNQTITVEANTGSVMELALNNNILGIEGKCGGVCSCATCHVYVAPSFMELTGKAGEIEKDMLEMNDNVNEYSRLSCQIEITEELDGLVVTVAK